jgi:hypothetical protein
MKKGSINLEQDKRKRRNVRRSHLMRPENSDSRHRVLLPVPSRAPIAVDGPSSWRRLAKRVRGRRPWPLRRPLVLLRRSRLEVRRATLVLSARTGRRRRGTSTSTNKLLRLTASRELLVRCCLEAVDLSFALVPGRVDSGHLAGADCRGASVSAAEKKEEGKGEGRTIKTHRRRIRASWLWP